MGLDYSSLETVMRLYKVKNVRKVFEQIQVIESGALVALSKRKGSSG